MAAKNSVLTPLDRTQVEEISSRTDIHGQRARALLALVDGASQAEAAEQASLSAGQVRYALARYRKVGLNMFPQEILTQATAEKEESPAPQPAADSEIEAVDAAPGKKSLPKKDKQAKKKSKKSKKDKKKDKAAKKGKKKSGKGKKKDVKEKKKKKKQKK